MHSRLPWLVLAACGIVGLSQSARAADELSDQQVTELDFGRPYADPQPAVDPNSPVDRMTRKTPHSDPATPLTQPPYPEAARAMSMEGNVIVSLLINEEGRVSRVRIKRGARYPILNAAALEGTRNWKLQPGTVQGKPVCMWGDFAVKFVLQSYFDEELAKVSVTPEAERLATLLLAGESFDSNGGIGGLLVWVFRVTRLSAPHEVLELSVNAVTGEVVRLQSYTSGPGNRALQTQKAGLAPGLPHLLQSG